MVPARNLLLCHYDTYGGFDADADAGSIFNNHKPSLTSSNLIMTAENHQHQHQHQHQQQPEPEPEHHHQENQENLEVQPSTSSHRHHPCRRDDSWLQLAIGPSSSSSDPSTTCTSSSIAAPRVELQLFERSHVQRHAGTSTSTGLPMFASTSTSAACSYRPPWGFWNYQNPNLNPNLMMPYQYYHHPYHVGRLPPPLPPVAEVEGGGPHLRVVGGPPERRQQHSGVWFVLIAAENQVREPFLPQIPKNYIRIKDGRMTVRLLMKYLVNKLGLSDESEIVVSFCLVSGDFKSVREVEYIAAFGEEYND